MFIVGEDKSLELLTQGPALKHLAPIYGHAPFLPANPSTSNGVCSGLNPYAGLYYRSGTTSWGASDLENHPRAFNWGIELLIIGSNT
jgi:hypothetical protein